MLYFYGFTPILQSRYSLSMCHMYALGKASKAPVSGSLSLSLSAYDGNIYVKYLKSVLVSEENGSLRAGGGCFKHTHTIIFLVFLPNKPPIFYGTLNTKLQHHHHHKKKCENKMKKWWKRSKRSCWYLFFLM